MKQWILWMSLLCSIAYQLEARQIIVCQTCSIQRIQDAVDVSHSGDTISIRAGLYAVSGLVVDKPLTILGHGQAILDGENKGEVMTIISDHVVVKGLTFKNIGTSYIEDRSAIRVRRSKYFRIENNVILNAFFGIYLEHASDGEITGNRIRGEAFEEMSSGNAIHLWYCKNIRIDNNSVSGHRDGIYLEFVDHSTLSGNHSFDNLRYGLHFMFSDHNTYSTNRFERNGAGVAVMFSKDIEMTNNVFIENWGKSSYGLLLKEIYDTQITDNIFANNTIGIYVEGSTRITYRANLFEHNGWAIKVSGGCLDNNVTENNFISNTFDLSISQNINENQFDGNFWSTYTGYDLDRDGIGDVPYRPVKLYSFVVNKTPETLILLRSLFVDVVNFAEKVSPVFTPKNVVDHIPKMKMNSQCPQ